MAIKFGSEVYTWFMDGYGEGNNNKLAHMAKVVGQAGFAGIEPMVLEPYDTYWLGDCKDPAKLKGKEKGLDHLPAFAKVSNNQIWPCIVEKVRARE